MSYEEALSKELTQWHVEKRYFVVLAGSVMLDFIVECETATVRDQMKCRAHIEQFDAVQAL